VGKDKGLTFHIFINANGNAIKTQW